MPYKEAIVKLNGLSCLCKFVGGGGVSMMVKGQGQKI